MNGQSYICDRKNGSAREGNPRGFHDGLLPDFCSHDSDGSASFAQAQRLLHKVGGERQQGGTNFGASESRAELARAMSNAAQNAEVRKQRSLTERTSRTPIVATPIFDREVMALVGIPSADCSSVVAVTFNRRNEYRYHLVA